MKSLSIDIETFSSVNLVKSGVYRYAEAPDFEVLLFGYSADGGEVQVVDLASGETIPAEIIDALTDEAVTKWAFNASFERVCLSRHIGFPTGEYLDPASWRCSMVWAATMGLPLSLEGVGSVLKLDKQKLTEGKELIKFFCQSCAPTQANGQRVRNYPYHALEKWSAFKKYNIRDVETEMSIQAKLAKFPVPDSVWDEYHLDQEINDRGVALDMTLVRKAIAIDSRSRAELTAAMKKLTELDNPNSIQQMQQWLRANGVETDTLGKKAVVELLKTAPPELANVLLLRQQLAKSSVKKYQAMENAVCADGRARGMFQFYGANRTGREAGRIIQLQNLPQNHIPDLEAARSLVAAGDMDAMELLYEDVPDTLSQLIRTAFIPKPGYKFIVADFSAIEARVIAWLAGETWRMDAFANDEDIYCASASKMFGVPVVKHGVNGHLRQKGKVAELACIAEGQHVLTNHGLIPIEDVTTDDLLWDGESWVRHEGVIYKGEREVITYEGLTATPDHLVWIEGQSEPVQFGIAAASGAHLVQTGNGRKTVRLGENNQSRKALGCCDESLLCSDGMPRMQICSMDVAFQSDIRKIERLSEMLATAPNTTLAGQTAHCRKATMRKSKRCRIPQLWYKGHSLRVHKRNRCRTVSDAYFWGAGKVHGNRPYRQQWQLCSGKSSLCISSEKQSKQTIDSLIKVRTNILAVCVYNNSAQTLFWHDAGRHNSGCRECCCRKEKMLGTHIRTARLYDIRNAGRHHRFTVSGKLVHNCGYGGSVGAMKAMGGDSLSLSDTELKQIVNDWRDASPNIVQLWWDVDRSVKTAVRGKTNTSTHGINFSYERGFLFITLPSGRRLAYVKPRIEANQYGGESVTYEGVGASKRWERLESYGPKFVENLTQAIARDLLFFSMQTLSHCFIVGHVHDEIIIECSKDVSVAASCEQMARTPAWAEGLLLRADGYECEFYKKD